MSMSWKSFFKNLCMKALKRGSRRREVSEIVRRARQTLFCPRFEILEDRVVPTSFTAGDIVGIQLASTSNNTTGSIIELAPTGSGQTPAINFSIPSTGSTPLRFSDSGTSSYLSDSNDGTLLVMTGYATTDSTDGDLSTGPDGGLDPLSDRTVATLNNAVTLNPDATSYTGISGNQTRSATTVDDVNYYITDKGGVYTNGGATTGNGSTLNTGQARTFGGTVYISSTRTAAQGNPGGAVDVAGALPGSTLTGMTGVPVDANIVDFYLVQSGNNGSTYDTLYTADAGTIYKFSSPTGASGTWTARGTYTGVSGIEGMIATPSGTGSVNLYVTTGTSVIAMTDTAAYTSNISVTTANNVTLFTTSSSTPVKSIAFAPIQSGNTATTTQVPTISPTGTQPYGTSETFTATVAASTGTTPPTAGSVTFESGSTILATASAILSTSGAVSTFQVTTSTVPVGTYAANTIEAVYNGGTGFNGSTSSTSTSALTITGTGTTAAVPTFTPTTAFYGQSVAFSDVVTATGGSTAPTGSVTFMNGSTVLATTTAAPGTNGLASTFTVSSTSIPVGAYSTITAIYNPGAGFDGATSNASGVTLTINNNATTTAVPTFTPTTVTYGQSVSFTAVVTDTSTSLAPTAGTVTFMSGTTVLATASTDTPSGATATFTVSTTSIPAGNYSNITAVYAPGTGFSGSTSSPSSTPLAVNAVTIPAGTLAQWTFENQPVSGAPPYNDTPAPDVGVGTADAIGMTNSYNSTTSTNDDDIVQGASGDTGTNGLADTTQVWRVRGQSPGNGWSSQAPIGTQGAQFFTSTVGETGPITVTFDWYATTQGEANLQLEYTTNGGTTWTNIPITVPAGDADITAKTNSSSSNTVMGSYVQLSGQQWAQGLTATINDPNADNDPNFAIEMVNASTGADDIAAAGTPLNNTSGNWRFDNVDIAAPQLYTAGNLVILQAGDGVNTYSEAPVSLNEVNESANNQVAISGTTADSLGNVTVTTTGTQNLTAGQWVQISGVQVGSSINTAYDGTYSILTVNNAGNTFTYFNQLAAGLAAGTPPAPVGVNPSSGAWATTVVQQDAIPDTAGSGSTGIAAATEIGTTVTITTSTTALYAVGESITLSGIVSGTGSGASAWDITEPVATVISSTQFTIQAPASLPTITSLTGAEATPPNQPLTVALNQANGNAQLNRSYDGSALTLDGVDSGTSAATSTGENVYGTADRDLAVITGNPNNPSDINTSTYGAWNGGDDNRDSVAETAYGPIYQAGHNNDVSGFPTYVGVHEFSTEGSGPTLGTQVSAATNIRAITIGPDNREYFVTAAGLSSVANSISGIYTDAAALPASNSTTPSADIMVVPNFVTNAKLNGMYIADMNGTGVISNGDRLYYVNGDTAGGAGVGGVYVATWNTSNDYPWDTPNNAGATAAGILDYWGIPVRLGDAPTQTGSSGVGQIVGITGTVLSLNSGNTPGTVELYTSAFDNAAGDSSIIQQWMDSGSGVTITNASVSGNTVTITTASPINFTNNEWVTVDGIGNGGGTSYSVTGATAALVTGGDNGTFQVTVTGTNTFTYTDGNTGLVSLSNAGGVGSADAAITSDLSQASNYQSLGIGINNSNSGNYNSLSAETFGGTIVETLAGGSESIGSKSYADVGLRGVAFAPVAATTVTLANNSGTLTATLTNSQVTPSGQVAFINENTGAVLGFGTISGSTATLPASTVVGDAYVEAYFAGGGTSALAPAQSNIIQVSNAGTTSDSVAVTATPGSVAVNAPVTLTATVTPASGPTGNVSFYNGTVSLANLLGTVALTGNMASLTTAFASTGAQTITAVYNGDATYESSSNTTTVNVAANATVAITSSANNVAKGSIQTFTATVTGNATLGTPTGTVTFTIVSAMQGASSTSSSAITLVAGANNTATAMWTGPALTAPGSYLVTMTYTPGSGSGYSGFSITPDSSGANFTDSALIENVDQAFTPGDLVVVQRGDGSVNTGSSGGLVELDEFTPTGTEIQAIVLPNSPTGSNNAFVLGSQNASQGLINRSVNGADLTLIGYDTEVGTQFLTSSFPYTISRTIAEIGSGGSAAVNTTTAITSTSPTAVPFEQEDVVSNDGNEFWIVSSLPTGDNTDSGIEYVSSVGATTATQLTAGGTTGSAITIAGGQLYTTSGGGNINAVGTGLPTSATQALTGLPNLQNEYQHYYNSTNRAAQQVLLLNTTDGTTNNPNVAYVADQDFGLLKFYLNNVSISLSSSGTTATATVSSGSLSFLSNGNDQVQITGAPGYNGTYTIPAANINGQTFTFTTTGSNLSSATGTAGQWLSGQNGTGVFGQKLVFAGGATGVTGNVTFNSSGQYTGVELYVTGANVQGLNPNEFVTLDDTNAPSAGFPSGNFNIASLTSNPNVDFSGISFVPGYVSSTTLSDTGPGATNTFTATVTSVGGNVPTGVVIFSVNGTVVGQSTLNSSGMATYTDSSAPTGASYVITAAYQGDVDDDTSNGTLTQAQQAFTSGNLLVSAVSINPPVSITSIAVSGTTATVTTTSAHGLSVGENVTITGTSVSGDNSATTTYTITAVPSTTTFTFTKSGFTASTGGTATPTLSSSASNTSFVELSPAGTSVQTVNLPSSGVGAFTEKGTTTTAGYITDSSDGETATLGGYNVAAYSSTSGTNGDIAVISPDGAIESSTQISSTDDGGSIKAVASADGLGFYVVGSNYVRYVPFGNSASTTTTAISNYYSSLSDADIASGLSGGIDAGSLYLDAGTGGSNGVPNLDGVTVTNGSAGLDTGNPGLPTTAGNTYNYLYGANAPQDSFKNYPSNQQFVVVPASGGNPTTIFVADARDGTDTNGGILEYVDTTGTGSFTLVGQSSIPNGTSSTDNGLTALSYDAATSTLYGVTTGGAGGTNNRIVAITGFTLNGNTPSFSFQTVATAPTNEAFRGVALAPTAPGATTSTTSLVVSNSPTTYGTPGQVTLTATVTAGATGWVSFRNNGVEIGSAPINPTTNTATFNTVGNLFAGNYSNLAAVYTGNSTYAASSSTPGQAAVVTQYSTTATLNATANPVATGVSDTLTDTLTVPADTAPTGTITFWDGTVGTGINLGTVAVAQSIVNNGGSPTVTFSASLTTTFSLVSTHNISAVYSGDINFTSYTATLPIVVVNPSTTVVTTNNTDAADSGASITYTARVVGASTTPTGTVQFYDNLLPIGSPVTLSSGSATITVSTALTQTPGDLTPGLHSISAIYTPDSASQNVYFTSTGVYEQAVQAQAFGTSDEYEARVGDGTTPLIAPLPNPNAGSASIGSTIFIDEYTPSGTLVQSLALPTANSQAFSVNAVSESGTTVTVTTATPNNFAVGQQVTIAGVTPSGYDGTFTITNVSGNTFTYTAASGLAAASLNGATAQGVVHAVVADAQQSGQVGQLSLSGDGQYLFTTGYDSNPLNVATAPELHYSSSTLRSAARISFNGTVQTEEFAAGIETGGNITGVYSPNGNSYYVGGYSGVEYFSSFAQSATPQTGIATSTTSNQTIYGLENDGGNLAVIYGGSSSNTNTNIGTFVGFPTTAKATLTQLPGVPQNTSSLPTPLGYTTDVYFTHLSGTGAPSGINTMYVSDNGTSYTNGSITKWSLIPESITSITESGTVATVTTTTALPGLLVGDTVTISGVTPSGYNGTFTATAVSGNTFTFTATSGLGTATGFGTASAWNETGSIPYSTNTPGYYWINGLTNGNTVTLYDTYSPGGNGDTGGGNLYTTTDTSGWDQAPSSTTVTVVSTLSSSSLENFNGVAFAPQAQTTTIVDNGPNPSTTAQAITLTVTVAAPGSADSNGATSPPTGTVTIEDASNGNAVVPSSGDTLSSGVATVTIAAGVLSGGTHNLFAVYSGDTYHQSQSSGTVSQVVNTATTTTVTSTPASPITQGTSITFTATIGGGVGNVGTVTFYAGPGLTNPIGSPVNVTSGSATSSADTTLPVGTDTITAVYSGGTGFAGSQGTESVVVNATTTTTVTSTPASPITQGTSIDFTATISGSPSVGTVTFYAGPGLTNPIGSPVNVSGGTATSAATTTLPLGSDTITAVYSGGTGFAGSQGTETVQVNSATTFQLSSATYTTAQGVGTYSITVTETGGYSGSITVPFTVTPGTAASPADFSTITTSPLTFSGGATSETITFSIVDHGTASQTSKNFSVSLGTPSSGSLGSTTSATVTITDPLLVVSGITPTDSGVYVSFNRAFDSSKINLYSSASSNLGAADVTLVNTTTSTAIKGSLVFLPAAQASSGVANEEFYFIETGETGPATLAPGSYTLTITSGTTSANGLIALDPSGDVAAGELAGNGTTAGTNYTTTFTVSPPTNPLTISIDDMTRGPTQSAGTAASPSGVPVLLTSTTNSTIDADNITAYDIYMTYNPADFTPTGFTSSVSGFSPNFNATYASLPNGLEEAAFGAFSSGTALSGTTSIQLGTIQGTIPSGAPYGSKEILSIVNSDVFDNTTQANVPVLGADAIHVIGYFGDTTGAGAISQGSASLAAQVAVGEGTGFTAWRNADPVLIADASSVGHISQGDASLISQKAVGDTVPSIPNVGPAESTGGTTDPEMYLVGGTGVTGGSVTVDADFSATQAITPGLNGLNYVISFNPSILTFNSAALGTYLSSLTGWSNPTVNSSDAANGIVVIGSFTSSPEATTAMGEGGVAFDVIFGVNSSAPTGPTTVGLLHDAMLPNGSDPDTEADNNNGALALSPPPSNSGGPDDATVNVIPVAVAISIPNQSISTGSTVTVPVDLTFNNAPTPGLAGVNVVITFNPAELQVTNASLVTLGSELTGSDGDGMTGWATPNVNLNNTAGYIVVGSFTSSPTNMPAGTSGDAFDIPFQLIGSASTYIDVNQSVTESNGDVVTTEVDDNGGTTAEVLSPAPTNSQGGPGDSVVTVTVNPEQPPYNSLPSPSTIATSEGGVGVLFNPSQVPGLHTGTLNTVVFSTANGDPIGVYDSSYSASGAAETTTVSVSGSPGVSSTGTVGMLSATASGGATVSGNGTSTITITGSPTSITSTLNGLTYTPGAGFYGTTTLTVSTDDNANSGYGGPITETNSTSLTVVGLFETQIMLQTAGTPGEPSSATISSLTYVSGTGANALVNVTTSTPIIGVVVGGQVRITGNSISADNGLFTVTQLNNFNGNPATFQIKIRNATSANNGSGGTAASQVTQALASDSATCTTVGSANFFFPASFTIPFLVNQQVTVSGVTDLDTTLMSPMTGDNFDGTFTITGVDQAAHEITVADAGAAATTSSGSPAAGTGGTATGQGAGQMSSAGSVEPYQYVEVESSVPNYKIPTGVELVGVNGTAGLTASGGGAIAQGLVTDIFNMGGLETGPQPTDGTGGYLTLLDAKQLYTSAGDVVGTPDTNQGGSNVVGFGNGSNSDYGNQSNVHTGGLRVSGQTGNDIAYGNAESFLLIQAPAGDAPTTSTNIDPTENDNPTASGSLYNDWNVMDSVGILDGQSTSDSYAAMTYYPYGEAGKTLSGSATSQTGSSTVGPWTASFVSRIAQLTAQSSSAWLASEPSTTNSASAANFDLNATYSTAFAGQPINNINAPPDWAPQLGVYVNDGTSVQHSQVTEITLDFSEPVNALSTLASTFAVTDANNNPLSVNYYTVSGGVPTSQSGSSKPTDFEELVITFNAGSGATAGDTFNFGSGVTETDSNGIVTSVGLETGNYFLDTTVADVASNANTAVLLDGAHTGASGSTTPGSTAPHGGQGVYEVDEFWRLFGDVSGTRTVDGLSAYAYSQADGTTKTPTSYTNAAASQSGNTVTVTTTGTNIFQVNDKVVITGMSVSGYDGTWTITSVSGNSFTFVTSPTLTGLGNATGGTVSTDTTGYVWYLDANELGNIDFNNSTDSVAFFDDYFGINGGTDHLNS